jgi:hypothetical protein
MTPRARAGLWLSGCLALLALAPLIANPLYGRIPWTLFNALYFVPQYVFPFGYAWPRLDVLSPDAHPIGHWASLVLWLLLLPCLAWLVARFRSEWFFVLAVAGIAAVTGLVHLALPAMNVLFWCEGPR